MPITVDAVYENGLLRPKQALAISEGAAVRLTIRILDEDDDPLEEVLGICDNGPPISLAERHDEYLYGIKPSSGQEQ